MCVCVTLILLNDDHMHTCSWVNSDGSGQKISSHLVDCRRDWKVRNSFVCKYTFLKQLSYSIFSQISDKLAE